MVSPSSDMNNPDKDALPQMDLEQAIKAAEHFSRACQIGCRVIDAAGQTLYEASPFADQNAICDLATRLGPDWQRSHPEQKLSDEEASSPVSLCSNAHLYGCYQAERFGGQYVYFCPIGLTHWASPVILKGQVVGALIGGPVHLVDPEDLLFDDLAEKLDWPDQAKDTLWLKIKQIPVVSTERVNSLSELLYWTAAGLSDATFARLEEKRQSGDLQAELWEQISFLKSYAYVEPELLDYPMAKEEQLLERIESGDKDGARQILNEILGHIFFSSSGSIEVMRARVVELVVLLSRAAIRGGADTAQIFGLNYTYLGKIYSFRNIDEIAFWLSGVMNRFSEQVFSLAHVKHADVIYRAVDYVRKHYAHKVTLEETAALVYLSPAYFSRIFKDEMKVNFNIYVNQVRVEAAKKLLLNDSVPLIDIANQAGFDGQSYFSKVFKKMTGVTPGKFRESRGRLSSDRQN
ncbi:MAG: PocR ligand-binding domain-containing protein [Eubacteriales bacterium]|nr:PocR ligand-binding domain-containing protein [Eubacteriales bacterium]